MTKNINIKDIPKSPGVYIMRGYNNEILYIGKAKELKKRISSYFANRSNLTWKISILLTYLTRIDYILTKSERDALLLEQKLIKHYQPKFNTLWRDDKSYPYIKITNELYPKIYLTRKPAQDGSKYYGPYPKVSYIRWLLKFIRKHFPIRTCKYEITETKKPPLAKVQSCLYYHIKECSGPCMGKISPQEYKKIVSNLQLFLSGRYNKLISIWEKEMASAAASYNFEYAKYLRDAIFAVRHLYEKINIYEISESEIEHKISITKTLESMKSVFHLPRIPIRIEAFDISNIFGKEAVGSMVTFANGEPCKDSYLRFKIKTVNEINDYAMLEEVLMRRYTDRELTRRKNLPLPDLILIDGGKGHLNTALEVMKKLNLDIPVISIAKKEEKIFYLNEQSKLTYLPVENKENDAILQYIRRIRDEAHRFAISYHKLLRKKYLFHENN
jgi:excinuclease ABC subunit C